MAVLPPSLATSSTELGGVRDLTIYHISMVNREGGGGEDSDPFCH